MSAASSQCELEQRVLKALDGPWVNHQDGYPRNMGNLARKAGTTTSEFVRTQAKLEREGRYFPPRG